MGSGRWSADSYQAAAAYRAARGEDAFGYDAELRRTRHRRDWTAHPSLDPFGLGVREARDSEEHPRSVPIAVLFDVTGSMLNVPRRLQQRLPALFGLLQRKEYVAHPQLLFGAVGDATCDVVPLQLGQFESDNRMDEQLGRILLEGGGGGQKTESYELAAYAMARHTALDCLERRERRGYLFLIGDELPYPYVSRRQVAAVLGERLSEDVPTDVIFDELQRRFDTYFLLPAAASYGGDPEVLRHWRGLLGRNVVELADVEHVCEAIALIVGVGEGVIDLRRGVRDLHDIGSRAGKGVRRALEPVLAGR